MASRIDTSPTQKHNEDQTQDGFGVQLKHKGEDLETISINNEAVTDSLIPSNSISCMTPQNTLQSQNDINDKQKQSTIQTQDLSRVQKECESMKSHQRKGWGKKKVGKKSDSSVSSISTVATSNSNKKSGLFGFFSRRSPKKRPAEKEEKKESVGTAHHDPAVPEIACEPTTQENDISRNIDDSKVQSQPNDISAAAEVQEHDTCESSNASGKTVDENNNMSSFMGILSCPPALQRELENDSETKDKTENLSEEAKIQEVGGGVVISSRTDEAVAIVPNGQEKHNAVDNSSVTMKYSMDSSHNLFHGSTTTRPKLQIAKTTNSYDYDAMQTQFSNASSFFGESALIVPPVMRHRSITSC
jgi:hypothetical protein